MDKLFPTGTKYADINLGNLETVFPNVDVGLTDDEKLQLTALYMKSVPSDYRGAVWHAEVKKRGTNPLEVFVFDEHGRIFLARRNDPEFGACWHHPGSVWNPGVETVPQRMKKLLAGELVKQAGITVSDIRPAGWWPVYKGTRPRDNPSRNALSLLYTAKLVGEFVPKEGFGFFPVDQLPEDTLSCHRHMIGLVAEHLRTGEGIWEESDE